MPEHVARTMAILLGAGTSRAEEAAYITLNRLGNALLASNHALPTGSTILTALKIQQSDFLYPQIEGGTIPGRKGSGHFIAEACERFKVEPNQLIYLGDDRYDFYEAVNNDVLFFLAQWASPTLAYGIPVANPAQFLDIISRFFRKTHLWYYKADSQDSMMRPVTVRALLNPDTAIDAGVRTLLKNHYDSNRGTYRLSEYLSLHLLASLYLEGWHRRHNGEQPIWCIYPGHAGGANLVLSQMTALVARLFRTQSQPTLLVRHTDAPKAAYLRANGQMADMKNQLQTIRLDRLNPSFNGRRVIVIDDFTTESHAFETARNFLINAGAADVVCVAVGKYGTRYMAYAPLTGVSWNSFAAASLNVGDFNAVGVPYNIESQALSHF